MIELSETEQELYTQILERAKATLEYLKLANLTEALLVVLIGEGL